MLQTEPQTSGPGRTGRSPDPRARIRNHSRTRLARTNRTNFKTAGTRTAVPRWSRGYEPAWTAYASSCAPLR